MNVLSLSSVHIYLFIMLVFIMASSYGLNRDFCMACIYFFKD